MADFQNGLISSILGVFSSRFLHRTTVLLLYNGFSHVFGIFKFWTQTDHFTKAIAFAWAIAFAGFAIFKIVSFLQYWVFVSSRFLRKSTLLFL